MNDKLKIALVDDNKLFIESLKDIIEIRTENLQVCSIAYNGKEGLEIIDKESPVIVLLDIQMPIMDGIETCKIIKDKWPHIKVVMLTTFDTEQYICQAMKTGANGYLLKNMPVEDLILAINALNSGTAQISPAILQKMITGNIFKEKKDDNTSSFNMTKREVEILDLLSEGLSNKEISEQLYVSPQSIKNRLYTIYDKLQVKNRCQATLLWNKQKN